MLRGVYVSYGLIPIWGGGGVLATNTGNTWRGLLLVLPGRGFLFIDSPAFWWGAIENGGGSRGLSAAGAYLIWHMIIIRFDGVACCNCFIS